MLVHLIPKNSLDFLTNKKSNKNLPTHYQHITNTLPTHYQHITNTLPTHYQHITNTLPTHFNIMFTYFEINS